MADFVSSLDDRGLLRVAGEDAEDFLQNIITNDMRKLAQRERAARMLYTCLLSPQGQYLHDFFIFPAPEGGGYMLDVEAARAEDLLRRIAVFRLRARVTVAAESSICVYAATGAAAGEYPDVFEDPRLSGLGCRFYTGKNVADALPVAAYHDFCVDKGVPCGGLSMRAQKDVMADVNLDRLNAVAWDKGCFIGQEVAARMYHRDLAKRRLFIVEGESFSPGTVLLSSSGVEAGEVRQVSGDGKKALAVCKVSAVQEGGILDRSGKAVSIIPPAYL